MTIEGEDLRASRVFPVKIKALIFDVDGTLADTEESHRRAFNRAFERHGLRWHWSAEEYARLLKIAGGKERMRAYVDSLPLDRRRAVLAQSARPRHPSDQDSRIRPPDPRGSGAAAGRRRPPDRRGRARRCKPLDRLDHDTREHRGAAVGESRARCARPLQRHRRGGSGQAQEAGARHLLVCARGIAQACGRLRGHRGLCERACRRESRRPLHRGHAEPVDARRGFRRAPTWNCLLGLAVPLRARPASSGIAMARRSPRRLVER